MPRPRRSNIGRRTRHSSGLRNARIQQTQEERLSNNEQSRNRTSLMRHNRNADEREIAIEADRVRTREIRNAVHNTNRIAFHRLAFNYDSTVDYALHPNVDIGSMRDITCEYCQAYRYKNEANGLCCLNGKVKLPALNNPPEPLISLVSGQTAESKHFLNHIRQYNNCFQMTSFGADKIISDTFMPTFKVQGQIYHLAGSLLPAPDVDHKFLQLYFIGNFEDEVDARCRISTSIHRSIIESLQNLFHDHNELIKLFKTASEQMTSDNHKIVISADKTPVGEHSRRFNAPTINEVAIVIVGDNFLPRDIVLHRRNNQLVRVSETHRSYDALQYPIIFWQGEDGYQINLKMIDPATGKYFNSLIFELIHCYSN